MSRIAKSAKSILGTFLENGFAVIPEFIGRSQAAALVSESERILDKYFVESEQQKLVSNAEKLGDHSITHKDEVTMTFHPNSFDKNGRLLVSKHRALHSIGMKLHNLFEPFKKATFSEDVKHVLQRLQYGNPIVFESSVVYKAPGAKELAMHQDESYYRTDPPGSGLAFWIALDDATEDNGCLQIYPGSHKAAFLPRVILEVDNKLKIIEENNTYKNIEESKFVKLPVEMGSLILVDGFLLHKSGPNDTDNLRRAYMFHLFDKSKSNWMKNNYVKQGDVYSFNSVY
ncbi:hypothetical protein B4U80_11700 [Leptotrombidium deliense]|uniref:Phytanoyl-CoA dioxygenase domain-containing protein 1-like protein n=1 Tax=Leptotrombidium deliense TaxID=299467 RepID=A0A443STX2_9ACAR|nr:hypothetical protein B4U80_11700 [Leptotrombidium deliense]